MLQITQLKIASNPFAKGFRDCDPEDWWVDKIVKARYDKLGMKVTRFEKWHNLKLPLALTF